LSDTWQEVVPDSYRFSVHRRPRSAPASRRRLWTDHHEL